MTIAVFDFKVLLPQVTIAVFDFKVLLPQVTLAVFDFKVSPLSGDYCCV